MIAFAEQGSSWDSAFNQRELHRQGDVALYVQQRAASGGKDRHTTKAKIDRSLWCEVGDPATSRNEPQEAANAAFSAC
jgi:hypothetical protein